MSGSSSGDLLVITSPKDGETLSGNVSVEYFVWAIHGLKSLAFYVDSVVVDIRTDFSGGLKPFTLKHPIKGAHTLSLKSTDLQGTVLDSAPVSITCV